MQINGFVVPVWDTFAADGGEDRRDIYNLDKVTCCCNMINDVVPDGLLVTGIDFAFCKDEADEDEPEPGDPEKLYGSGEAGFLNVFGDLKSALRACSQNTCSQSIGGDTWLGGNLPKSERLQLNEILLLHEKLAYPTEEAAEVSRALSG